MGYDLVDRKDSRRPVSLPGHRDAARLPAWGPTWSLPAALLNAGAVSAFLRLGAEAVLLLFLGRPGDPYALLTTAPPEHQGPKTDPYLVDP